MYTMTCVGTIMYNYFSCPVQAMKPSASQIARSMLSVKRNTHTNTHTHTHTPPALGVELDLSGAAVDHGARPDGHHGGVGVKHPLRQHRLHTCETVGEGIGMQTRNFMKGRRHKHIVPIFPIIAVYYSSRNGARSFCCAKVLVSPFGCKCDRPHGPYKFHTLGTTAVEMVDTDSEEAFPVPKVNGVVYCAVRTSCCLTRTSRGTSSGLVQPPRGDSQRTGFLNP